MKKINKQTNTIILHKAIDILDNYSPTIDTAFITDSNWTETVKYIQLTILHDNFDYHTFETFEHEKIVVEVLIFPKSYLTLVDKHFDFLKEYNLIDSISNGILIRDNHNNGEKIQQMYDVIKGIIKPMNLSNELNKNIFEFSRLVNLFRFSKSKKDSFILKNKLTCKLHKILTETSKDPGKYNKIIAALQLNYNSDTQFLKIIEKVQYNFGWNISFFSENNFHNSIIENKIEILISSIQPIDGFISGFLLFFLGKLKKITRNILFSFKLYSKNQYLITIWAKNEIIKNSILPTLDLIYSANNKLYINFKPKYPFKDKRSLVHNLIIKNNELKELQILISSHLLYLKLNRNNKLSEGYRISYGIHLIIEIMIILKFNMEEAKQISSSLFSEWLSLSYETEHTNYYDLEVQSHHILNEFENIYLSQFNDLEKNFRKIITDWELKSESIIGLKLLIGNFEPYFKVKGEFLNLITNDEQDKKKIVLEIMIYEAFSILGITNYYKAYITYTLNRLLYEA